MFERIKEWYANRKAESNKRKAEYREEQLTEKVNELYQVCEIMGEIWLTYDGHPVCPMALFKDETINVLLYVRSLYMVLNKNKL